MFSVRARRAEFKQQVVAASGILDVTVKDISCDFSTFAWWNQTELSKQVEYQGDWSTSEPSDVGSCLSASEAAWLCMARCRSCLSVAWLKSLQLLSYLFLLTQRDQWKCSMSIIRWQLIIKNLIMLNHCSRVLYLINLIITKGDLLGSLLDEKLWGEKKKNVWSRLMMTFCLVWNIIVSVVQFWDTKRIYSEYVKYYKRKLQRCLKPDCVSSMKETLDCTPGLCSHPFPNQSFWKKSAAKTGKAKGCGSFGVALPLMKNTQINLIKKVAETLWKALLFSQYLICRQIKY